MSLQGHASSSHFYQYLLNVSVQTDCDIHDDQVKAKLVEYALKRTTWFAGARVARESAIATKWPDLLARYQDTYVLASILKSAVQLCNLANLVYVIHSALTVRMQLC